MADKRVTRLEAHDAAGFESGVVDWNDYDDGYGSNVMHGDLSMQRLVEGGIRDGLCSEDMESKAYDLDPFMSRAQAGMMHAHAGEPGFMSKAQVAEFDKKTDFSHLPEHVKKHKR